MSTDWAPPVCAFQVVNYVSSPPFTKLVQSMVIGPPPAFHQFSDPASGAAPGSMQTKLAQQ